MLIRFTIKSAVWSTLALVLAACAVTANPTEESNRPTEPPPVPTRELNQPVVTPTVMQESVAPATVATEEPSLPPTATAPPALVLPDLGPAPDITNEVWLNTDQPLNLAALRGRVVLVEFWTFG